MVAQARVPDSRTGTVLAPAEPAAEAALIVVLSPSTIAHVDQIARAGWDGPVLAVGSVEEARALLENTELDPREIIEKSLTIAGDICVYTNHNFTIEELEY